VVGLARRSQLASKPRFFAGPKEVGENVAGVEVNDGPTAPVGDESVDNFCRSDVLIGVGRDMASFYQLFKELLSYVWYIDDPEVWVEEFVKGLVVVWFKVENMLQSTRESASHMPGFWRLKAG